MTDPLDPDADDEPPMMMGAFDPIAAYVRVTHALMRLADVTQSKPGVLPAHELLRATQVGLDTIAIVGEATTRSIMGQVLDQIEESDWEAHNTRRREVMDSWSEADHQAYRMSLIHHVAPFIPYEELIPDTPESLMDEDDKPKDQ